MRVAGQRVWANAAEKKMARRRMYLNICGVKINDYKNKSINWVNMTL